jgi:hypothetical protein
MRFSEADTPWQPIPSWADYLIKCGFAWGDGRERRRIGIISVPCESAGVGLVALGAIRYRLTLADANDALSHFERIERLAARQDAETCLRHQSMKGRFRLDGKDQTILRRADRRRRRATGTQSRAIRHSWRFAKRRSAFRTSSFFRSNPAVSVTFSIERFGCCWLWMARSCG